MDFKPSSPASPAVGAASSVLFAPTVNRFEPLSEVQVSAWERIPLNPPSSSPTEVLEDGEATDEDDIDEAFLSLGILHHNPNISIDTEMTDELLKEIENLNSKTTEIDPSKRRKRVWADAAKSSHKET